MPNTVTIYMDKHTVTWKKQKNNTFQCNQQDQNKMKQNVGI